MGPMLASSNCWSIVFPTRGPVKITVKVGHVLKTLGYVNLQPTSMDSLSVRFIVRYDSIIVIQDPAMYVFWLELGLFGKTSTIWRTCEYESSTAGGVHPSGRLGRIRKNKHIIIEIHNS